MLLEEIPDTEVRMKPITCSDSANLHSFIPSQELQTLCHGTLSQKWVKTQPQRLQPPSANKTRGCGCEQIRSNLHRQWICSTLDD